MDLNCCWKGFEERVTRPHNGEDEARFEAPPVAASNLTSCSTHISKNEVRFGGHPAAASNLTL